MWSIRQELQSDARGVWKRQIFGVDGQIEILSLFLIFSDSWFYISLKKWICPKTTLCLGGAVRFDRICWRTGQRNQNEVFHSGVKQAIRRKPESVWRCLALRSCISGASMEVLELGKVQRLCLLFNLCYSKYTNGMEIDKLLFIV